MAAFAFGFGVLLSSSFPFLTPPEGLFAVSGCCVVVVSWRVAYCVQAKFAAAWSWWLMKPSFCGMNGIEKEERASERRSTSFTS